MQISQFVQASVLSLSILPLIAGNALAGSLIIDDYTDTNNKLDINLEKDLKQVTQVQTDIQGELKGMLRKVIFEKTEGTLKSNLKITESGLKVAVNNDSKANSKLTLDYSLSNATRNSLPARDLSGFNSFNLDILYYDFAGMENASITMNVNGVAAKPFLLTGPIGKGKSSPITAKFSFSDFLGVDFSK